MVDEGGVGSVTRAMEMHGKNLLLQRAACRSLYNMAVAGGGYCLDEISHQGGVTTILAVVRRYHRDPVICWSSIRLVSLLAEGAASWEDSLRDQVCQW